MIRTRPARRSGRAEVHRHGAESVVGGRHHSCTTLGGLACPGGGAGRVVPAHRWMVDGRPLEARAGAGRVQDGRRSPPPPNKASCTTPTTAANTPASPSGGVTRAGLLGIDGNPRRRLRQRRRRKLLRDAECELVTAPLAPATRPASRLRLHRRLLQPADVTHPRPPSAPSTMSCTTTVDPCRRHNQPVHESGSTPVATIGVLWATHCVHARARVVRHPS